MAGSEFFKTIVLPILLAAILYLAIFHAILPFYRRYQAKYSQYIPLQSAITSRLPEALQPSTLRDRLGHLLLRVFLPSTWAVRERIRRRESVVSADDALFDDESGEAMVGFNVEDQRHRRREGMERQVAQGIAAAREMAGYNADSARRLSRELEEGFRDDSEEEDQGGNTTSRR